MQAIQALLWNVHVPHSEQGTLWMELEPEVVDTGKGQVAAGAADCFRTVGAVLPCPVSSFSSPPADSAIDPSTFSFFYYLGYPVLISVTCKVIDNIEKYFIIPILSRDI